MSMGMELTEIVKWAGIAGAGGAGFPTHVKLAAKPEYVIVNGAECEPLLRVDRQLGAACAKELLAALSAVAKELGAKHAVYALKEKYHEAVSALSAEVKNFSGIEIFLLPNMYPAGDEQVLVYEVTKRIVPEGGIPLAVGCVVINVETLLNIYNAIHNGRPVTEKYLTVTGAVRNPATVKVPLGVSFEEVIALCEGPQIKDYAVIEGGPMMGKLVKELTAPVTKTTKGLILLPSEHPVIASKNKKLETMMKLARSACCHCMLCTDVCPRALLGHSMHPDKMMRIASYGGICDNSSDITEAFLCCECGLCEQACIMGLQPWKLHNELKRKLAANGIKNPRHNAPEAAHPFREYRKFPISRLVRRLGLNAYDAPALFAPELVLTPQSVTLPLRQSAGAPAVPVVAVGEHVAAGDLVAEIPERALGCRLHASISGEIKAITGKAIRIEKE